MSCLYCPRCEKPLDNHDQAACNRRMSRRYFFGVFAGAILAAEAPKPNLFQQWASQPIGKLPMGSLFATEPSASSGAVLTREMVERALELFADLRDRPAPVVYVPAEHYARLQFQSPQFLPVESLVTAGVRDGKPSRAGSWPRLRNTSQRESSAPPQQLLRSKTVE